MISSHSLREIKGLDEKEVAKRQQEEGPNDLPTSKKKTVFSLIFEVVKEPMFLLLIACGVVYLLLGDIKEALILLSMIFVVIAITFYQENKTERALDALRDLSSPRALVIRNGEQKRIAGRDLVREDIIILAEGDRVPADSIILSCNNLMVDESLLTGESVPVRKSETNDKSEMQAPGGDDLPCVFSGTLVVSGTAIAKVKKIGLNTEIGKIGKSLQKLEPEKTLLQKETSHLVKLFAIGGSVLCAFVILLYGLTRGQWLESFLAGITLAIAILPEEFPVVLTVFLALGAWRMSRKNVLARRQNAIQALGSVTVLCVDKTGTLTINKMAVKMLYNNKDFIKIDNDKIENLPGSFHELVEFVILSSQKEPFDPMEKALKDLSEKTLKGTRHLHYDWDLLHEYPLSKKLLAISHVWKSPRKEEYIIAAKGAPESIADLCHLSADEKSKLTEKVYEMANNGLRVIATAKASMEKKPLPDNQHAFKFEFLGLIGFEDPVRPNVHEAIKECYTAGIRVVMITGDYPVTAKNIAKQIGLANPENIMTGQELDSMKDEELKKEISKYNIFARVIPEQKLRIVEALKANHEIVAMTGDGVNDAPALKSAHIGIAMGARGTDVAREASSVVLLDDDFSSIVKGVKMGRRIFDNIRKAMAYVFAIHIPIAGITFLSVLFGWPLLLLPVHIVFLELIIDPSCSVVFEAEKAEENIMKRRPRSPKEKIFNKSTVKLAVLQGIVVLVIISFVFKIAIYLGKTETEARALSFVTLIIANLCLIMTNRSWSTHIFASLKSRNDALWFVIGGAIVFLAAAIYIPHLRNIFKFDVLHLSDIVICFSLGILSILWFEIMKIISQRRFKKSQPV